MGLACAPRGRGRRSAHGGAALRLLCPPGVPVGRSILFGPNRRDNDRIRSGCVTPTSRSWPSTAAPITNKEDQAVNGALGTIILEDSYASIKQLIDAWSTTPSALPAACEHEPLGPVRTPAPFFRSWGPWRCRRVGRRPGRAHGRDPRRDWPVAHRGGGAAGPQGRRSAGYVRPGLRTGESTVSRDPLRALLTGPSSGLRSRSRQRVRGCVGSRVHRRSTA